MQLVLDWDGTVTVRDSLVAAIHALGDPSVYDVGIEEFPSYGEALAAEIATLQVTAEEAARWAVENVEVSPGFHELVERYDPVIVSSGLPQLILPVLEREGVERRGALERRRGATGRLARDLPRRGRLPDLRRQVQAPFAARRAARSSSSATAGRTAAPRSPPTASSRAPASPTTSTSRASSSSATTRCAMSLLRFPEPYDFELSTGRFRVVRHRPGEPARRRRAAPRDRRPRRADPRRARRRRGRAARRRDAPGRRASCSAPSSSSSRSTAGRSSVSP